MIALKFSLSVAVIATCTENGKSTRQVLLNQKTLQTLDIEFSCQIRPVWIHQNFGLSKRQVYGSSHEFHNDWISRSKTVGLIRSLLKMATCWQLSYDVIKIRIMQINWHNYFPRQISTLPTKFQVIWTNDCEVIRQRYWKLSEKKTG